MEGTVFTCVSHHLPSLVEYQIVSLTIAVQVDLLAYSLQL
jgi:hypothetical protein